MRKLPNSTIPVELQRRVRELGRLWAICDSRPRLSLKMKNRWKKLIREWARSNLPIVVRKSGGVRGSIVIHSNGRKLVFADNSPAQWSFLRAFEGHDYSLRDIKQLLNKDQIPFALTTKASEKAQRKFKCKYQGYGG